MISAIKIVMPLFFLINSTRISFAQVTFEEQFGYAKKLYDSEEYFDAVTEFKRLLFFDNEKKYAYKANLIMGLSYKQGEKFSDALSHFSLAEINARNAEEIFDARVEIIKVNILRRTTNVALALLDSLQNDKRFNDRVEEINYWRGWAYIFADNWEEASLTFAEIDSAHQLKILADSVNNSFYDVTLSKILSIFLPGAGQFYTGEYISGLLSLGWNLLWGYLTINSFVEERIFDGFMIGTLLWWRFYTGNLRNAEKFALEKNLNITNNALKYLKYNYPGKKP